MDQGDTFKKPVGPCIVSPRGGIPRVIEGPCIVSPREGIPRVIEGPCMKLKRKLQGMVGFGFKRGFTGKPSFQDFKSDFTGKSSQGSILARVILCI